jgi:hypothetical protein
MKTPHQPNRFADDDVVWSWLLILQSKRLLLNFAESRLRRSENEEQRQRVARLRMETDTAQDSYRRAWLHRGSPMPSRHRVAEFGRLIAGLSAAAKRLRRAASGLPAARRFEMATDVQMLDDLVGQWQQAVGLAPAANKRASARFSKPPP